MSSVRQSQHKLMSALVFTSQDLEANRDGYMTKAQRRKLYNRRWGFLRPYSPIIILSLLIYLAIVVDGVQKGNLTLSGIVIGTVVLLGIAALCFAVIKGTWDQIKADLHKGNVAKVVGKPLAHQWIPGSYKQDRMGSLPEVRIGDSVFTIPQDAVMAFIPDDTYCIYYAPNSHTILSVEHLRHEPAPALEGIRD